jgi:hypothetical protein
MVVGIKGDMIIPAIITTREIRLIPKPILVTEVEGRANGTSRAHVRGNTRGWYRPAVYGGRLQLVRSRLG